MRIARFLFLHGTSPIGMTVLHVGAHRGQEATSYQNWAVKRVIWVEANPKAIPMLEANIRAAQAAPRSFLQRILKRSQTEHVILQALVGDADGPLVPFHLYDNDGASNSIFRKTDAARDAHPHVSETGEVLELPMTRLDTLLRENGIEPSQIDFATLDVQGAELLCLKGAPDVLESLRFLETEISKEAFYDGGVLLPELDGFLRNLGFKQRRWLRKWHMNAIYTR